MARYSDLIGVTGAGTNGQTALKVMNPDGTNVLPSLVTVTHNSNITLNPSSAFIGLATVVIGGMATVTLGSLIAGEDQTEDVLKTEQQFAYTSITSNTTVAVKNAAGFFHLFNIGMPSCPTTTFYDSATPSGTVIKRIAAGYPMGSHILNSKFTTGLSVDATSGGVVAEILVAWR